MQGRRTRGTESEDGPRHDVNRFAGHRSTDWALVNALCWQPASVTRMDGIAAARSPGAGLPWKSSFGDGFSNLDKPADGLRGDRAQWISEPVLSGAAHRGYAMQDLKIRPRSQLEVLPPDLTNATQWDLLVEPAWYVVRTVP